MGFLIRMAFWFSLVLLALPLGTGSGENGEAGTVGLFPALMAARDAAADIAGLCERQPDVCATGRAAFHTIGERAKESARIAYDMLDEKDAAPRPEVAVGPQDITTGSIPAKPAD
jgi:hypothetical protein